MWNTDQEKMVGIRPEHIQLSHHDGLKARVESLEFRGASYRLQVQVEDGSSNLYKKRLKVDISATTISEFQLCKDMSIMIKFPELHLLTYEEPAVI